METRAFEFNSVYFLVNAFREDYEDPNLGERQAHHATAINGCISRLRTGLVIGPILVIAILGILGHI